MALPEDIYLIGDLMENHYGQNHVTSNDYGVGWSEVESIYVIVNLLHLIVTINYLCVKKTSVMHMNASSVVFFFLIYKKSFFIISIISVIPNFGNDFVLSYFFPLLPLPEP